MEPSHSTNDSNINKLNFRFGALGAAVPLLFFIIWAITTSVLGLSSENGEELKQPPTS